MKKTFAIIVTLLAILSATQANILLTDLGSSTTSVYEPGTNILYTLNTSSTQFSGISDSGSQITWLFNTSLPLADINSQNLFLNFSLSGTNPNSGFHIDLYNSDGTRYYTFTGTTNSASSVTTDISLTYASNTGGAFSSIFAAGLFFDGLGSTISSMTVSNLNYAAVPEPSTYALLGIGAVGLFLSFRRRKV
jgi:hypothetical protein